MSQRPLSGLTLPDGLNSPVLTGKFGAAYTLKRNSTTSPSCIT